MMVNERRQEVVAAWMQAVVKDGGIERYHDLHVDQIDEQWKPRSRWMEGALDAFDYARTVFLSS